MQYIKDKLKRFWKWILFSGVVATVALGATILPQTDQTREFTILERQRMLKEFRSDMFTNVIPNHRGMIQEILNKSAIKQTPNFDRFNESEVNIREAYKDTLEMVGDTRSSEEDFNAPFEILNKRVREYMLKGIL